MCCIVCLCLRACTLNVMKRQWKFPLTHCQLCNVKLKKTFTTQRWERGEEGRRYISSIKCLSYVWQWKHFVREIDGWRNIGMQIRGVDRKGLAGNWWWCRCSGWLYIHGKLTHFNYETSSSTHSGSHHFLTRESLCRSVFNILYKFHIDPYYFSLGLVNRFVARIHI